MLVLVKANGNPAYSQPSPRELRVNTNCRATALAVARLWAATQQTIRASKNGITVQVIDGADSIHTEYP